MPMDCFGARARLQVGPASLGIVRLDAHHAIAAVRHIPSFVKVLLENLLCHADGATVDHTAVEALARWTPRAVGNGGSPSPPPRFPPSWPRRLLAVGAPSRQRRTTPRNGRRPRPET